MGNRVDRFNKLYLKRRSTYNFNLTKDFNMDAFKNVIKRFSSNMPSKQHQFPYKMYVLDWSDRELRKDIFYGTKPEPFTRQRCFYNNQTLAPILICFTCIIPTPDVAKLEIGMASMTLTYLLQSNGFLTSFCQCIQDEDALGTRITGEDNTSLELILSVGQHAYPKNTNSIPHPFAPDEVLECKYNPIHQNIPNIKYKIDKKK